MLVPATPQVAGMKLVERASLIRGWLTLGISETSLTSKTPLGANNPVPGERGYITFSTLESIFRDSFIRRRIQLDF